MKNVIVISAMCAMMVACASRPSGPAVYRGYQPMVDAQSIKDEATYQRDMKECRSYAQATKPSDNLFWHIVSGDKRGLEKKVEKFEDVYRKCMQGRNYSVLG